MRAPQFLASAALIHTDEFDSGKAMGGENKRGLGHQRMSHPSPAWAAAAACLPRSRRISKL